MVARSGAGRSRDECNPSTGTRDGCWHRSTTGPLLALRASDGEILWQRDLGASLQGAPAPAGDRVYLPLKDGRILALALQTGEEIWAHKLSEAAVGILPVGDRVFVGARDNHLHSLEANDATTDWKWQTGADVLGLPVLDEKRVYFVALDNVLRGHNRNSGSMLWKRVLPMRPFTGPLLSGQTLIMARRRQRTACLQFHRWQTGQGRRVCRQGHRERGDAARGSSPPYVAGSVDSRHEKRPGARSRQQSRGCGTSTKAGGAGAAK